MTWAELEDRAAALVEADAPGAEELADLVAAARTAREQTDGE